MRVGANSRVVLRQPRQHAAHRRSERQRSIDFRVDERLQPHPVADEMHATGPEVDQREGEHPAESGQQALDAPGLVGVQDEFGVGARAEAHPARLEAARVGWPVVDLAVVRNPDLAVALSIGWSAIGPRIDDRKPRVHEPGGRGKGAVAGGSVGVERDDVLGIGAAHGATPPASARGPRHPPVVRNSRRSRTSAWPRGGARENRFHALEHRGRSRNVRCACRARPRPSRGAARHRSSIAPAPRLARARHAAAR